MKHITGKHSANFRVGLFAALLGAHLAHARADRHYTTGANPALLFGTHEIVLTGNGRVSNPFDTSVQVRFTPPSGEIHLVVVDAFYDGGNTWRARVYVTETGLWQWQSTSPTDASLHGRSGTFQAQPSTLRGLLWRHKANPKQWATGDGRWFLHLSDTAYRLFHNDVSLWKEFVRDATAKGINSFRVAALGGWGGTPQAKRDDANYWVWNDPWTDVSHTRFDLAKFQNTDQRLIWIFDNYPDVYLQLVLFGLKGYGEDTTGRWWFSLPQQVRTKTMRYLIARWSAFPNLYWLIVNDLHCDTTFPKNQAFIREVGRFFSANEPWRHLIAAGPNRFAGYPFADAGDADWSTYVHIEDQNAVGALQIYTHRLSTTPLHVFMAEDHYEQDYGHYKHPNFFFRWLFWSWIIAGGSGNYGGRWGVVHPYSQSGRPELEWVGVSRINYTGQPLHGLDSVPYIRAFFEARGIDMAYFRPDDALITDPDGRRGRLSPKLARRAYREFLIYAPNAIEDGKNASLDKTRAARLRIDLREANGMFCLEWYSASNGIAQLGGIVNSGEWRDLGSPWVGHDVVARLTHVSKKSACRVSLRSAGQ
jgi:hypothetical protein